MPNRPVNAGLGALFVGTLGFRLPRLRAQALTAAAAGTARPRVSVPSGQEGREAASVTRVAADGATEDQVPGPRHEGRAEERVAGRRVDVQESRQAPPQRAGHVEADGGTLRAADPVALMMVRTFGPVDSVEVTVAACRRR